MPISPDDFDAADTSAAQSVQQPKPVVPTAIPAVSPAPQPRAAPAGFQPVTSRPIGVGTIIILVVLLALLGGLVALALRPNAGTQTMQATGAFSDLRGGPAPPPPASVPDADADAESLVGSWNGYRSSFTQVVDERSGKVVGEKQSYDTSPSEEIVVVHINGHLYQVTHRYKDGSFSGTDTFTSTCGKLVHGDWRTSYKGTVPTIWRSPDEIVRYEDGVSGLRLVPQAESNEGARRPAGARGRRAVVGGNIDSPARSFLGCWLITSEGVYLFVSMSSDGSVLLSEGTARPDQVLVDGVLWNPPSQVRVSHGRLEGITSRLIGDTPVTMELTGPNELTYRWGGLSPEVPSVWTAKRIARVPPGGTVLGTKTER
jgi:hypothetical protein